MSMEQPAATNIAVARTSSRGKERKVMSPDRLAAIPRAVQGEHARLDGSHGRLDLRLERVAKTAGGLLDDLAGQLELLRVLVHARLEHEQLAGVELLARHAGLDELVHHA